MFLLGPIRLFSSCEASWTSRCALDATWRTITSIPKLNFARWVVAPVFQAYYCLEQALLAQTLSQLSQVVHKRNHSTIYVVFLQWMKWSPKPHNLISIDSFWCVKATIKVASSFLIDSWFMSHRFGDGSYEAPNLAIQWQSIFVYV